MSNYYTTGEGWTCPKCLRFMPYNTIHSCPDTTTGAVPHCEGGYNFIWNPPVLERIAVALERIAAALEKL